MILLTSKQTLDLNKTLNCGQCFNWDFYAGAWYGFIDNYPVRLQQDDFGITIEGGTDLKRFGHYFDLDTYYEFKNLTAYERQCENVGKGIRIIRQPLFETLITFIISQQNTMSNIKRVVHRLCTRYGKGYTMRGGEDGFDLYSFPQREDLIKLSKNDIWSLNVGYRTEYIYEAIQTFTPEFEEKLKSCNSYEDAIKILMSLKGVGIKVANCVALFGLHYINAFPIDTHIQHILDREYTGFIDTARFNGKAGIMQQYMYYAEAFNV